MGTTKDEGLNSASRAIYSDKWCILKSCDKRFAPKTHNQEYCSKACQLEMGKRTYQAGKKKNGGMHFSKLKNSPPMRRILALLKKKRQTTLELQIKGRVCNPATWVSALRHNGFNIVCECIGRDEKSGARVYRYQLIKGAK